MDVNGKIAVITGAGSGIGRALAQAFAQAGANAVVCTDLHEADAVETAGLLPQHVGSAAQLNVADADAIATLVAQTEDAFGHIDIFVSNAGYGKRGGLDLSDEDWQAMMDVHMWSHLSAARAVIPGMVAHGGGYLLNTASAAGLLTQLDSGPYAVSKHAAVAFAEWMKINYAEQGIGVSVLCPQAVRTNILGPNAGARKGASNTRQAAQDGILEPEFVAQQCLEAIAQERFLVLPHPEVETYFQRKANDYDRWIRGMQRFRARLQGKG